MFFFFFVRFNLDRIIILVVSSHHRSAEPSSGLVRFGLVWSAMICFLLTEGKLDRDLLKADSERLQASMPGAGFEPADALIRTMTVMDRGK